MKDFEAVLDWRLRGVKALNAPIAATLDAVETYLRADPAWMRSLDRSGGEHSTGISYPAKRL